MNNFLRHIKEWFSRGGKVNQKEETVNLSGHLTVLSLTRNPFNFIINEILSRCKFMKQCPVKMKTLFLILLVIEI